MARRVRRVPRVKGEDGAVGPQGPKGDDGAQGPQGQQGPQGDTGLTGGNVAGATVVSSTKNAATITVSCDAGQFAVGGGGKAASNRTLEASYHTVTAGSPTGWTVVFSQSGNHTAYVVCINPAVAVTP